MARDKGKSNLGREVGILLSGRRRRRTTTTRMRLQIEMLDVKSVMA